MHDSFVEEVARRLRYVVAACGESSLKTAVLVGPEIVTGVNDFADTVCGLRLIACPTMGDYRLGGVTYKVARTFEDA